VLESEPSASGTTQNGRTVLFFLSAPEERAIEIAELLLQRGLDPELTDADGMTAADVALKSGFDELAELLREARPSNYRKV
jgi:ankyrin repeat protein